MEIDFHSGSIHFSAEAFDAETSDLIGIFLSQIWFEIVDGSWSDVTLMERWIVDWMTSQSMSQSKSQSMSVRGLIQLMGRWGARATAGAGR